METLRGWKELGVVDTIYEEDQEEDYYSSTPSLSPPLSPLHSRVEAWALSTGCETDVVIQVGDSSFYLHKGPLAARSGYLKRQFSELSKITLSPPLNITAETFTVVAGFCYGAQIVITPFNVAALRVAAELLEMSDANGGGNENLGQKAEAYFRREVALSCEYAQIIFRSCLLLLPEVETTVALASRSIEALSILLDDDDGVMSFIQSIDGIKTLRPEHFEILAESMHSRLTRNHDLLYRIVDLYLKEQGEKLTEEHKLRICNFIDCTMLSPQLVMHAVQNPRMPLRFVVQAMFVEQLNTRRCIISAAAITDHHAHNHARPMPITLGAILQRDAALRQTDQLKTSMAATSSRIQLLEKELDSMRQLLHKSANRRNGLEDERSVSFRLSSENNKIERGDEGSVSSASFRIFQRKERIKEWSSPSEGSSVKVSPRAAQKSFSKKLINTLKNAFWRSSSELEKNSWSRDPSKMEANEEEYGNIGDFVVIKKDVPFHQRYRSLG